jgi:hypothetical protein
MSVNVPPRSIQNSHMLGILTLDTAFPRVRGDVGCADTFAFPVRIARVPGATVEDVVHRRDRACLAAFVATGRQLADDGCFGLATTCGFLARWQRELAAALPIPILTSALLQLPLVEATLPAGKRAGIITYSAADLGPDLLAAAGSDPTTPVAGVDPDGYFAHALRHGAAELDVARMERDTVFAARALLSSAPEVGAIVLECANMPPYRDAVATATGLAVFDAAQCIAWFHAGLMRPGRPGTLPREIP